MQAYNDWIADLHPAFARLISRLEIQTVVEYEREVTLQPHEQWVEHGGFMMINKKYADLKFILNRVNGEFVVSIEEVRSCVTHFVFRPRKSFKRAVGRLSGPRWRGTQTRGVAVDMNMVLALSLEEINKPSEEKKNARLGKGSIESVVESLMLHRTLDVTKPRVAANGVWFIEEDTETGMRCRTLLRTEHNEPRRCKTVTDAVIYGDDMVERDEVFALGMGESTLERRRSW